MKRAELDVLSWLAREQRSVSHLLAMSVNATNAWLRAHRGKTCHTDAVITIRNGLRSRQPDIDFETNVVRWRA